MRRNSGKLSDVLSIHPHPIPTSKFLLNSKVIYMFTNPAKQLRLVVFPFIYRVLFIQPVVVWDFFHQQYVVCMLVYKLIQQIQVDPIKVDGAELSSRLTSDCQLVGSP